MSVPADEALLLERARRGDREAAGALIEASYRTIYASLFRLTGGDAELAADLTQETYRRAWSALPRFAGGARFSTWVYRIAYNAYLNHVRRPRRLLELSDERPVEDPQPGPEQAADERLEGERLRRAVLALPDDLRFTVSARYWGEHSVREIAEHLGLTAAAVRKRLKKAMGLLALSLEETSS